MKHLADLPVRVLAGYKLADLQCKALPPYASEALAFLADWSRNLFARADIRSYPDMAAFAYWCRPAHLARLSRNLDQATLRLGRGLALHIAPANVPVNFAYSFAFGLLAGNVNVVRVPEGLPAQAEILCAVANDLLKDVQHARVASMTSLISYPRDDTVTAALSAVSDVRLLWGGDQTIDKLRRMPTMPRCVDIAFADRYSLCLLNAPAVLAAESNALHALASGFYNDVFLLDQNACSSPHLVLWQGTEREVNSAQDRFWGAVKTHLRVKGQALPEIQAVDKYTHFCRSSILMEGAKLTPIEDCRIFRVQLGKLPENIAEHRGRFGFFFETIDNDLSQLKRIVNARYQTLTCFGVAPDSIARAVVLEGIPGLDRIVPVGKALDIGVIWDGYDILNSISRIVSTS